MLIEFAGVPGSGKSHLCLRLQRWFDEAQIECLDIAEFLRAEAARTVGSLPRRKEKLDLGSKDADILLKSFRHFFLDEPEYTLLYLRAVLELESSRVVQDLILSSFNYACAQRGFFQARSERVDAAVIVHEEGLVHRLFTLCGYRRGDPTDELVLTEIAERTPLPDILIWTRCPASLAIERLGNRERKMPDRLVGLKVDEAAEVLAHADSKLETVARILARRGAKVAEVRTDVDFDEARLFEALISEVSDAKSSRC